MSCVTVVLTNITTCNRHKKHPDSDPQFVDNRKCCLSLSAVGHDYYVIRAINYLDAKTEFQYFSFI